MTYGGEGGRHTKETRKFISIRMHKGGKKLGRSKGNIPWNKGRTNIELHGEEKAAKLSKQRSLNRTGKSSFLAGKTYVELYGEKEANLRKAKIGLTSLGRGAGIPKSEKLKKAVSDANSKTLCITNGIISKRISKTTQLPKGFRYGFFLKKRRISKKEKTN